MVTPGNIRRLCKQDSNNFLSWIILDCLVQLEVLYIINSSHSIFKKMDSFIEMPPEEDPENMPTATEELLQIVEDFADYIEKFMFEIVTFLAVVDSAMGLIKDVLGLFGFEGWKLAFFPTFSFIVTTGVFLFGAQKRKGKRDADVPEGLAEAFDAIEDVMEVVEDVAEELEEIDNTGGSNVDGELGDVLGDVTVVPTGSVAGAIQNKECENEEDANMPNSPANDTKNVVRKVIAVTMLAASVIAKLKKKRNGDEKPEYTAAKEGVDQDEGNYSRDIENHMAGTGSQTPQETSLQIEWESKKAASEMTAARNRKPFQPTTHRYNDSAIIDLDLARQEKRIAERDCQNVAKKSIISAERQLRRNTKYLAREAEEGASEIKSGIEISLRATSIQKDKISSGLTNLSEANINSGAPIIVNPVEMVSGMVKNTTDLTGSAVQNVDQQARKGLEETRKKSGSILHIAIRLVRLVARVVNKKKGGSSTGSEKGEGENTEKIASNDIKGSTASLESDSIYFDCLSSIPKQSQRLEPLCASYKSLSSIGTQTDLASTLPQYHGEPQSLRQHSNGMLFHEARRSHWDNVQRPVLSMPDTSLLAMRDAADEEMRSQGSHCQLMKMVNDSEALRPAWLGTRNDVAERSSKQTGRDSETYLDVRATYSRPPEARAYNDRYVARFESDRQLDAEVILHPARGMKTHNRMSRVTLQSNEREADENSQHDFLDARRPVDGVMGSLKPASSLKGVVSDRDCQKNFQSAVSDNKNGPAELDNVQSIPGNWGNGVGEAKLDASSLTTLEKSEREAGNRGVRHNRAYSEERIPLDEKGFGRCGLSLREVQNYDKDHKYDVYDECDDRSLRSKAKNAKRYDLRSSQRTINYSRSRNLVRSVSCEQTEGDFLSEDGDCSQDTDCTSVRSAGYIPKRNRGQHFRDAFPLKKYDRKQSLVEVNLDEKGHFLQRSTARSPTWQSGSSESLQSSRSLAKQSRMSLSSVRFADEDARFSSSIKRQGSKRGSYVQQTPTKRQIGRRNSRRKITAHARWKSAIGLTGHQNSKMSLSPQGSYINDDYTSDDLPSGRQINWKAAKRRPSISRNSLQSCRDSRVRSASYLSYEESDEGTQ